MGGIGWVVCWWMDGGFFGCMCESWIGKWLIHGLVGRSERCEKQSISLNMSVHVFPHFFSLSCLFAAIGSLSGAALRVSFQALELLLYWPVSRCCKVQRQSPITNHGGSGGEAAGVCGVPSKIWFPGVATWIIKYGLKKLCFLFRVFACKLYCRNQC